MAGNRKVFVISIDDLPAEFTENQLKALKQAFKAAVEKVVDGETKHAFSTTVGIVLDQKNGPGSSS